MTSMKIGINLSKKANPSTNKPAPAKRKPIFGGDDDSDTGEAPLKPKQHGEHEILTFDEDLAPQAVEPTSTKSPCPKPAKPVLKTKQPPPDQTQSLSSLRSTVQTTNDVDPSIYDYDTFHAASTAAQRARKEEASKSSKAETGYMNDLLAAAEQRKKDQLRAKDRLLQREREQEGDDFKDKDMFVTEAYKEHQAEMQRAEAEEKKREEEQERKKVKQGMSGFHRGMMDEQEKRHREALEAEQKLKEAGVDAVAETEKEAAVKQQDEAQLAAEAARRGQEVELNEEGQVTDKRDLLSGGLNVVSKPKPPPFAKADSQASGQQQAPQFRPDFDARRAQRERHTRMMEQQLEESQKRKAEQEEEEVKERESKAKSRKTESEVSSAKERYLARKREKELEKARGDG